MSRRSRMVGALIVVALVGVACSSGGGGGGASGPSASGASGQRGGSYSFANCEPEHLTPQNDYESCGSQVFNAVWTRLMDYNPDTNEPIPAQAQSVTSNDSTVWTIEIKPGWTFHNGEPVTAQSYLDAWNWAALGSNGAILNSFFSRIEGYDALNPSKGQATSKELSGLKVMNDTTFQVTLSAPFSQFPVELGFDAFDPLPKAFFDDPEKFDTHPIGDGPYKLDEWKRNEVITLSRYDNYAGTPGYADKIQLTEYNSFNAAWADFQAGNIDIDNVYSDNLLEAQQNYSDSLAEFPSSALTMIGLPLYLPEYQNKLVRQALSLAINREAIMNAAAPAETPASSFATPVIPGYREGSCTYCKYDPTLAKQKLQEAGGWQGGTMTIELYADDPTLEQIMEAIGNQWKQNLGIEFQLNPINSNAYYGVDIHHEHKGPWWDGWIMDYPSLEDYVRPLYGTHGSYNVSGYSNTQVDDLLNQGDQAGSIQEATATYQKAEDIVDEDMPSIPFGYLPDRFVHSTHVTNVHTAKPLDALALADVQVVQ